MRLYSLYRQVAISTLFLVFYYSFCGITSMAGPNSQATTTTNNNNENDSRVKPLSYKITKF